MATVDDVRHIVGEEISSRGLATVKDVRQIVKDEVFQLLSEYHANMVKPDFDLIGEKIDNLGLEVSHVKDTVNGLKAEFSDTPSRREFYELKSKVDRIHSAS